MNQFIDENCNSSFSNSFLKMNQFICLSQINPNELNANSFMNGNGPCTILNPMENLESTNARNIQSKLFIDMGSMRFRAHFCHTDRAYKGTDDG